MSDDKIFCFDDEFEKIENEVNTISDKTDILKSKFEDTSSLIDKINQELSEMGVLHVACSQEYTKPINELNDVVNGIIIPKYKDKFGLSVLDVIVSVIAGVLASVIDIIFVGTPEVVKIWRGGENFDGSILTKALRNIGNGDDTVSETLKWFSEKCKVPYDISTLKGVANPNNHRLRNFAHDPFFGLLFSIADIILGTATLIDGNGNIRVVVNDKNYPESQKYLAVFYYLGHLLSDICTARGLPIPGFFATQFFAGETQNDSIAIIAEGMYKDGYDLRHLASMSTPVAIKDLIIKVYISLCKSETRNGISTIAEKEINEQKYEILKSKLMIISDAVCCSGNILKFFLPPTAGNITALNISEWLSLLKDTIIVSKYYLRDKTVEKIVYNRAVIDENWLKLFDECDEALLQDNAPE